MVITAFIGRNNQEWYSVGDLPFVPHKIEVIAGGKSIDSTSDNVNLETVDQTEVLKVRFGALLLQTGEYQVRIVIYRDNSDTKGTLIVGPNIDQSITLNLLNG